MITGLNRASEGQVLYKGQPLAGVNPHATIVFQTFALLPWLTVQENVEVALKARSVPEPQRRERARQLLDKVGLDGFESAYRASFRAGCAKSVALHVRWPSSRSCSAWTSRSARWMCSAPRRCAAS